MWRICLPAIATQSCLAPADWVSVIANILWLIPHAKTNGNQSFGHYLQDWFLCPQMVSWERIPAHSCSSKKNNTQKHSFSEGWQVFWRRSKGWYMRYSTALLWKLFFMKYAVPKVCFTSAPNGANVDRPFMRQTEKTCLCEASPAFLSTAELVLQDSSYMILHAMEKL